MINISNPWSLARAGSFALAIAVTPAPRIAKGGDPYAAMAPVQQYLIPGEQDEIALAKSAAPASIADHAEIRVLDRRGYHAAVAGTNGFVCLVVRAWDNNFASAEFWNPKMRSPHCFNPAAARSVLPTYVMRTEWALSGLTKEVMKARDKTALAAGQITAPEPGAMVYMLSKSGYLGDGVHGPWHPHVMFVVPRTAAAQWGAGAAGSPVDADDKADDATTVFFVPVPKWSDGTPDVPGR